MNIAKMALLAIIFMGQVSAADDIIIYNKDIDPVTIAHYLTPLDVLSVTGYKATKTKIRKAKGKHKDEITIKPGEFITIMRPTYYLGKNRELAIVNSEDAIKLKAEMGWNEYSKLLRTNIASSEGLIIKEEDGKLVVGKEKQPVLSRMARIIRQSARGIKAEVKNVQETIKQEVLQKISTNKHASKKASVEKYSQKPISKLESDYISNRRVLTHASLENFLGESIDPKNCPRVALCLSGGGFRAMIAGLGFLMGVEDIGLLDSVDYIAGLSGGTWILGPWLTSGETLTQYKNRLQKVVKSDFKNTLAEIPTKEIVKRLLSKILSGQSTNTVDLYGMMLSNTILRHLGNDRFFMDIYDSHKMFYGNRAASKPFPIYTSVEGSTLGDQAWCEYTPFDCGVRDFDARIPIWAYDRKFKDGKSVGPAITIPFGTILGTCGSAYTISVKEYIDMTIKERIMEYSELTQSAIEILREPTIGQMRLSPADVRNFSRGLTGSPLKNSKKLTLVDAGLAHNLPIIPIYQNRDVDVIIICEASGDVSHNPGNEYVKFERYATKRRMKIPRRDGAIKHQIVTVFEGKKDDQVPTIVYIQLAKNSNFSETFDADPLQNAYMGTFNFLYNESQFGLVSGVMKQNVIDSKKEIIGAIKRRLSNSKP